MTNTIIMQKVEILLELPKCDTDMKWVNAVGKTGSIDLWQTQGCHKPSICEKKKNLKPPQYLLNALKWGMSVNYYFTY